MALIISIYAHQVHKSILSPAERKRKYQIHSAWKPTQ